MAMAGVVDLKQLPWYIDFSQLEQEMETTVEDEDSSEESTGFEVEIVYQAGNCIICFNLKVFF
jgi:CRISPR/Cas system-associated protein Cas7 (RAMP superfamily)